MEKNSLVFSNLTLFINNIINNEPFINALHDNNISSFLVGGIVRDLLLNKQNKDIDILVENTSLETIKSLLSDFGKIDIVGESFSVIKFRSNQTNIEYDIAILRIDEKIGSGHKGFNIISNENITVEQDLFRRDFTINSIAVKIDASHEIIDPYNGINALVNGIIETTNPEVFIDDPLRILRAVQFSMRFGFPIELQTGNLMCQNIHLIKEIPGERIHEEFLKIFKHAPNRAIDTFELLIKLGFYKALNLHVTHNINFVKSLKRKTVSTPGEFFWILLGCNGMNNTSTIYLETFRGETKIAKQIDALVLEHNKHINNTDTISNASIAAQMLKITKDAYNFTILGKSITRELKLMNIGAKPAFVKDLQINGNDCLERGLIGSDIGNTLSEIFELVINNKLQNNRIILLNELDRIINLKNK